MKGELSTAPISTESWVHERYGKDDLQALMNLAADEKRTGQLTIHLSQGAVHSVEWRARRKTCDAQNVLTGDRARSKL